MASPRPQPSSAFTLVEIMIVVAVIALLAVIAVPSFLRARKRSQASLVKNDLRLIDSAIAQYAIDTNKVSGSPVYVDDWIDYIKANTRLYNVAQDVLGNPYGDQTVDVIPYVPAQTWDALSDVADTNFWAPFPREPSGAASGNAAAAPARHFSIISRARGG